jgi:hypothetical protein
MGLPHIKGPRESGNLKFTIYALVVPKMHHIKFEKNWSSGYQVVKNMQMLIDTLHHVWPEIHNFSKGLPTLHYHAFSFSYIHVYVVSERSLKKNSQIWHFLPHPIGPRGAEILKFTVNAPLSLRCIIPNLKMIGAVVIKKLEIFKC